MIKKNVLSLIALFLIQLVSLAQPPQLILPKWKVGDSLLVKEKGTVKVILMGMDMPMDINTEYRFKVTAKDAEGYTIEVSNINYMGLTGGGPMEGMMKMLNSDVQEAMKKAENMKLIVRISLKGEVLDLMNWKEVQQINIDIEDGMLKSMAAKYNIPQNKIDSIKLAMNSKAATKEEIMQQTLSPVEYVMSGYNIKYPFTGKLNVLAVMYSRMNYFELNKKGVPATLSTRTVSRKAPDVLVAYDVVYNKQALLDYINKSSKSKYISKDMLDKMVISEDRSFDYNMTTTWPRKINMNSHMTIDKVIDVTISSEYIISQY